MIYFPEGCISMPFDGITIAAVCRELDLQLKGHRIERIYQPEKDEIIISTRNHKSSSRLLISANPQWARLHSTESRRQNPSTPPAFCMLLRKYLEGGKIKAVRQVDFERIIHLRVEAPNNFMEWKEKILVCEFMGKHSNIILINPETGVIIDAIKKYSHEVSTYREVLPGKQYVFPPSQGKLNPREASYDEFARRLWQQQNQDIARALFAIYSGLSPFTAREICSQVGLDPCYPAEQCGEFEIAALFRTCQSMIQQVTTGDIRPTVLGSRRGVVEFAPYEISATAGGILVSSFSSINQAADYFFTEKLSRVRLDSLKTNLLRSLRSSLEKAYRRAMLQEGDLVQAEAGTKYRLWGELLTTYAHQLQKGQTRSTLEDYYSGETVEIDLLPHLSPIENAQKYFKLYNKARASAHHAQARLQVTREEIDYLESVVVALEQAATLAELEEIIEELEKEGYVKGRKEPRRLEERSQPRVFISSDGLKILAGRNNRQNDRLTLKESAQNDLWLHAKGIPGTHVIVHLPKHVKSIHQVPDRTLEEAALLAAYYSKGNDAGKVPVDYTFRQNVKKPKGAKPGMVVYENYWTIYVSPSDPRLEKLLK